MSPSGRKPPLAMSRREGEAAKKRSNMSFPAERSHNKNYKFGRGERIRTSDPLHPMQVRYQAAPRPDRSSIADFVRRPGMIPNPQFGRKKERKERALAS